MSSHKPTPRFHSDGDNSQPFAPRITRARDPIARFFFRVSVLGGFRAQGRTAVKARQLVDDALAVQEAGAFAIVVECVPSPVGKAITEALEIPTIGIGAGAFTSGQVCEGQRRGWGLGGGRCERGR